MTRGEYLIWMPQKTGRPFAPEPDIIVSNLVTDEGWNEFLKMVFQDTSEIASGANWYIGLCQQVPNKADALTDISSELTSAGSYARKAIARSSIGWPTVATVNGKQAITSMTVTFSASGANFSSTFNRLFLTDQASGTSGKLYSYSGALTTALQVANGESFQTQYRFLANQ